MYIQAKVLLVTSTSTTPIIHGDIYYDAVKSDFYDVKPQCPPVTSPVPTHTYYMSVTIEIV